MKVVGGTAYTESEPSGPEMAAEMRATAAKLIELAAAIDGSGEADLPPFTMAQAERNQSSLTLLAEAEYRSRQCRSRFVSDELLGEPGWDMLLDLFIRTSHDEEVTVTSACHGSGVPKATALRWLSALEEKGLVKRSRSNGTGLKHLELTTAGYLAVARSLVTI